MFTGLAATLRLQTDALQHEAIAAIPFLLSLSSIQPRAPPEVSVSSRERIKRESNLQACVNEQEGGSSGGTACLGEGLGQHGCQGGETFREIVGCDSDDELDSDDEDESDAGSSPDAETVAKAHAHEVDALQFILPVLVRLAEEDDAALQALVDCDR